MEIHLIEKKAHKTKQKQPILGEYNQNKLIIKKIFGKKLTSVPNPLNNKDKSTTTSKNKKLLNEQNLSKKVETRQYS
jgi:hypothetical protein